MINITHHTNNDKINVILLGKFNPTIFHPQWFECNELIRPNEAENADIQIIHPDIALFFLHWLRLEVSRERFRADLLQDVNNNAFHDLIVSTFALLSHTPIHAMGFNYVTEVNYYRLKPVACLVGCKPTKARLQP